MWGLLNSTSRHDRHRLREDGGAGRLRVHYSLNSAQHNTDHSRKVCSKCNVSLETQNEDVVVIFEAFVGRFH